jgi:hypothetical protein
MVIETGKEMEGTWQIGIEQKMFFSKTPEWNARLGDGRLLIWI